MFRKVEESQTLLINTQSKDLESQNKKIIKLGFGQSPFLNIIQQYDFGLIPCNVNTDMTSVLMTYISS